MMDINAPPIGMLNSQQLQQQQLSRSKSLNDISNDSQISAFASDRFINLHNNGVNMPSDGEHVPPGTTTCMPINPYIYNQNNVDVLQNVVMNNNNNNFINTNGNIYGNLTFDNSRNLNNNQCSRPNTANVFNLCNPLAINLNGVTEQIGNLHL